MTHDASRIRVISPPRSGATNQWADVFISLFVRPLVCVGYCNTVDRFSSGCMMGRTLFKGAIVSASYQNNIQKARNTGSVFSVRRGAAALLFALCAAQASAAYNPAFCQSVTGTLNIHWRATTGPFTPCTGIEFTNGTLADASDGSITMAGTSVSNAACLGLDAYAFTLSNNTTQLVGRATGSNVPMTLTRGPGEPCFVGTWTQGVNVFEAHIWAGAFPLTVPALPAVPGPGAAALALLAAMIGVMGGWFTRRRV